MAKPRYDDDLFKDSTMTFGEHLEELRTCLIRSLIGLAVGVAVGVALAKPVVRFLEAPMREALTDFYQQKGRERLLAFEEELAAVNLAGSAPPYALHLIDDQDMMFDVHYLDMSIAWNALVGAYPSELSQIRLPVYEFRAADITTPQDLAALLTAEQPSDAAVARFARLLDKEAMQAAREIVESADGESGGNESISQLVAGLNRLIRRNDLYEESAFEDISLAEHEYAVAERVESLSADGELPWFNRRLLAAAFPALLAAPSPTLSPTFLWRQPENDPRTQLKTLNAPEPFLIYMKAAIVTGLVVAGPWIFFQIWTFVAAGLYPHERKYVYIYGPMSLALFLGGVATAFIFVFEPVLGFLMSFNDLLGLAPDPRMSEFLSFVLLLPLGFGVSFQLPLVMLFLERIGIFTIETYKEKWRMAILVICVVSAFLTPQDPMSMMIMALPLSGLYGVGILLCRYMPRPASDFDEA